MFLIITKFSYAQVWKTFVFIYIFKCSWLINYKLKYLWLGIILQQPSEQIHHCGWMCLEQNHRCLCLSTSSCLIFDVLKQINHGLVEEYLISNLFTNKSFDCHFSLIWIWKGFSYISICVTGRMWHVWYASGIRCKILLTKTDRSNESLVHSDVNAV